MQYLTALHQLSDSRRRNDCREILRKLRDFVVSVIAAELFLQPPVSPVVEIILTAEGNAEALLALPFGVMHYANRRSLYIFWDTILSSSVFESTRSGVVKPSV